MGAVTAWVQKREAAKARAMQLRAELDMGPVPPVIERNPLVFDRGYGGYGDTGTTVGGAGAGSAGVDRGSVVSGSRFSGGGGSASASASTYAGEDKWCRRPRTPDAAFVPCVCECVWVPFSTSCLYVCVCRRPTSWDHLHGPALTRGRQCKVSSAVVFVCLFLASPQSVVLLLL